MPAMDIVDKPLGPRDEFLVSRRTAQWRKKVWQSAVRLLEAADPGERESLLQRVEKDAFKLGRLSCVGDKDMLVSPRYAIMRKRLVPARPPGSVL